MMKKVMKKLNKIKKRLILLLMVPFCAIIGLIVKSYADDNLNTRPVSYDIGSTVHYVFDFFTDSIKFHIRANGYENVLSQDSDDNFASIVESGSSKMQGYGNYVMKADTSLFSFIEWCHNKNAYYTEACAITPSDNPERACDYNKLMSYKGQVIAGTSKQYMNTFWQNMTNLLGDTFKQYQDSYFFEKYTYKATQQVGINLAKLRSYVNNDEYSVKEYLTCLTSYMFSYEKEAAPDTMEVKKGDVVPFLYYKRNVDEDDPQEIAKYAYVALIEGWVTGINGTHLWENEYQYLYGSYDPDDLGWDLETLEAWYSECYDKYKGSKGRKGNNLLGSDIETIIQSDYSVSQQLEATEHYLNQVFTELGIETNFKETMAKNELMAKYMMENSNFSETIKDYNDTIDFMTENIQRGTSEEKNTHTAVLSDFQVIELNHTLNVDGQSDGDGISDKTELGAIKWVDITEFVRKAYEDAVRSGQSHRATFEEQVDDIIYANGGFYNDITGNYIDGSVKWADNRKLKVLYRTYDYRSNPLLNDTDFDGIDDNTDSKPIDNKFTGTSTDIGNVSYNNDFRWFFTDKTKYNDELAVMSLIASNLANGNTVSTNQASGNIQNYLMTLGFSNIQVISTDIYKAYIGKKIIDYYGNKKEVVSVFIGEGNDRYINYDGILYAIDKEINEGVQYTVKVGDINKKTYEEIAREIVTRIYLLIDSDDYDRCFWVSGYDVGGAIASEVSRNLIKENSEEVYCYTFGVPNTSSVGSENFANIKNIINADDLNVRLEAGSKPGQVYMLSIYEDLMNEYKDITGSNNYKGNYLYTNYVVDVFKKFVRDGVNMSIQQKKTYIESMSKYLVDYEKFRNTNLFTEEASEMLIAMNECAEGNRQAHSIKSYYVLAKSINGFDLIDYDYAILEKYNRKIETPLLSDKEENINKYQDVLSSIEKAAVFYINNVATYQSNLKFGGTEKRARETNLARNVLKPYLNNLSDIPNNKQKLEDNRILYTFINSTDVIEPNDSVFIDNIESRKMSPNTDTSKNIYKKSGHLWYDWTNDIKHNINVNKLNDVSHTRDDCSGFAKLVTVLSNSGKNINIYNSEDLMNITKPISQSLLNNGYEMFVYQEDGVNKGKWVSGKKVDETLVYSDFLTLSIDSLKPGDMLVCKNHVEFYVGYDYNDLQYNMTAEDEPDKNKRKKSGIAALGEGKKIPITDRANATFGWGDVNDEYPTENKQGNAKHYFYQNEDGYFQHCECGKDPIPTPPEEHSPSCSMNPIDPDNYRQYKVIWRKN